MLQVVEANDLVDAGPVVEAHADVGVRTQLAVDFFVVNQVEERLEKNSICKLAGEFGHLRETVLCENFVDDLFDIV